ncbi:beta-eliminating lyase-related protein [Paenibacillus oryzisoli]|uniref:threonine aldolase family protein n=1 Tax=Paenibacillus oryzisoli TaxID=1850517 RepID=UPI003D287E7A
MTKRTPLAAAFHEAKYQVPGNGQRNVQVLKNVLEGLDGSLDSDHYGTGELIEQFQSEMAALVGKESAVFFPSGTMAQQIALRIWSDAKGSKKVAYHPLSHLEIHEQDGLKELHHLEPVLLGEADRLIRLDDVTALGDDVACLLLELPQREIGGELPPYDELEAIAAYCRGKGIKLHLDGARLFEILPYYGKTATEVCALFDSVYFSFYKGIGGIAGAILAGDESFTTSSKVWKRRHGGDLIALYPYFLSGRYYMEQRLPRMAAYYAQAVELAAMYNGCAGLETKPAVPVSNMFHVHAVLPAEQLEEILIALYKETGIGLTGYLRVTGESSCYFEVSVGDSLGRIPQAELVRTFERLAARLWEEA